jgi:RimJ/RimL family protein N-acetyltransferase
MTLGLARQFDLHCEPFSSEHAQAWMNMYRDPQTRRQMYTPPRDLADLCAYLREHHATSVFLGDALVGGYTLTREIDARATFGILVAPGYRGCGIGDAILMRLERHAHALGIRVLRADVYSDNTACLSLLHTHGFREFVWLEKNLSL